MKRFGLLLVALFSLGLLAGCGAVPHPGTGMDNAVEQDGGTHGTGSEADGLGIDRLGASSSRLGDPNWRKENGTLGAPSTDGSYGSYGSYGSHDSYGSYDVNVEPEHRIRFDFDSARINEETARVLAHNAAWIRAKLLSGTITIEGHCDERGTREYNLALGQQRADAVRQFLISQGLDARQLESVSYGKERPLVWGHDERSWRENRRAELVLP